MRFWKISTIIDSCDSGCPNEVLESYYTNYDKALCDFEFALDDAADCGYAVALLDGEDVDGVIRCSTTIKSVEMYQDVTVIVCCLGSKETFNASAATRLEDIIEELRKKYPGNIQINGDLLSEKMRGQRLFELSVDGKIYILFAPKCGSIYERSEDGTFRYVRENI